MHPDFLLVVALPAVVLSGLWYLLKRVARRPSRRDIDVRQTTLGGAA